jgi:hypothetical protein
MSGMKKHRAGAKTKRDPNSPINKALRRWNCESIEEMQDLIMLGEQYISEKKKSEEKRCPQCGMTNCSCKPGTCKCKPIDGWVPGKGFKKAMDESALEEKWTQKYKSSINCSNPKGFSQKAHCAGKKK